MQLIPFLSVTIVEVTAHYERLYPVNEADAEMRCTGRTLLIEENLFCHNLLMHTLLVSR